MRPHAFLDCVHRRVEPFGTGVSSLKARELERNAFDETIVNVPAEHLWGQPNGLWPHVRLEEIDLPQLAQINLHMMAKAHLGLHVELFQVCPAHQLASLSRNLPHSAINPRRSSRRSERK